MEPPHQGRAKCIRVIAASMLSWFCIKSALFVTRAVVSGCLIPNNFFGWWVDSCECWSLDFLSMPHQHIAWRQLVFYRLVREFSKAPKRNLSVGWTYVFVHARWFFIQFGPGDCRWPPTFMTSTEQHMIRPRCLARICSAVPFSFFLWPNDDFWSPLFHVQLGIRPFLTHQSLDQSIHCTSPAKSQEDPPYHGDPFVGKPSRLFTYLNGGVNWSWGGWIPQTEFEDCQNFQSSLWPMSKFDETFWDWWRVGCWCFTHK